MNRKVLFITQAAVIAALYVVLTQLAALLGLSSGAIQVRFSEALTILPYFIPSAIPGVTIGCFLANLLTGGAVLDIVFGSIATLIGCVGVSFEKAQVARSASADYCQYAHSSLGASDSIWRDGRILVSHAYGWRRRGNILLYIRNASFICS